MCFKNKIKKKQIELKTKFLIILKCINLIQNLE